MSASRSGSAASRATPSTRGLSTHGYAGRKKERTTAAPEQRRTTKVEVLRLLAQLDADEARRYVLNSGQYVMQQAVDAGLVTDDEHSMASLTQAVDQLV